MTASAHQVAAAIRLRAPGVGRIKVHQLLYFCQGYHLVRFGVALFEESIYAQDVGPVVDRLWYDEDQGHVPPQSLELDEGQLNTIGYVVSRYGGLSRTDLRNLTHGESPWRQADQARQAQVGARIEVERIHEYFKLRAAEDWEDGPRFDPADVAAVVAGARERLQRPARRDDLVELQRRLCAGV